MSVHFKDILLELSAAKADFILVGAHALAVHGLPRATQDFDLWVKASSDNASKVIKALKSFGAPLHNITPEDLSSPGIVFQVGLPPNRIDILTSISGVTEFDEAKKRAVKGEFLGAPFLALGYQDLLLNKENTGRKRDLLDAEWLKKNPPDL